MGAARSLLDAGVLLPGSLDAWGEKVSDQSDVRMPRFRSGHWYRHPEAATNGSHGPGTNTLIACPLWLPKGTRTVQFAEWCITPTASAVRRGGLYLDTGECYPGNLLMEFSGTIDCSTAGWKAFPAYTAFDWPDLLWYAVVSQGAVATMMGITNALPWISVGTSGVGNANPVLGYTQAGVTGALPGTFTSTITVTNGVGLPHFKIE